MEQPFKFEHKRKCGITLERAKSKPAARNPNKWYYSCPKPPIYGCCKFFIWEEELIAKRERDQQTAVISARDLPPSTIRRSQTQPSFPNTASTITPHERNSKDIKSGGVDSPYLPEIQNVPFTHIVTRSDPSLHLRTPDPSIHTTVRGHSGSTEQHSTQAGVNLNLSDMAEFSRLVLSGSTQIPRASQFTDAHIVSLYQLLAHKCRENEDLRAQVSTLQTTFLMNPIVSSAPQQDHIPIPKRPDSPTGSYWSCLDDNAIPTLLEEKTGASKQMDQ